MKTTSTYQPKDDSQLPLAKGLVIALPFSIAAWVMILVAIF